MRLREYNRILSRVLRRYGLVHVYHFSDNANEVRDGRRARDKATAVHTIEIRGSGEGLADPEGWKCVAYVTAESPAAGRCNLHHSLRRGDYIMLKPEDTSNPDILENVMNAEASINRALSKYMPRHI